MKQFLGFILLLTIFCVNCQFELCAQKDGIFPSRLNCNEFYICKDNVPSLKKCPLGYHYNHMLFICDHPADANCTSVCKDPDGLFPHPYDCGKFYQCANNVAYLRDCPDSYHFNPALQICDYEDDAGCLFRKTGSNV